MRVWELQRGHRGNGCDLGSTLCKYDLRKLYLIVLSWGKCVTSEAWKHIFRVANV